jgi:hypothetical protein
VVESFEICWSCGTTVGGEEDPGFVRADELGPAPGAQRKSNHILGDELELEAAEPEIEVVDC